MAFADDSLRVQDIVGSVCFGCPLDRSPFPGRLTALFEFDVVEVRIFPNEIVEEPGILLMLRPGAHNLQPSMVVTHTQTRALRESLDQAFIVLPADLMEDQR
jgi:hypothetical protein